MLTKTEFTNYLCKRFRRKKEKKSELDGLNLTRKHNCDLKSTKIKQLNL